MTIILGLDPSLAAFGWASWTDQPTDGLGCERVRVGTIRTSADGLPPERHARILRPLWSMLRPHTQAAGYDNDYPPLHPLGALVVVEARIPPPEGKGWESALDRAELRGVLMYGLRSLRVPAAVVPVPTLKKYATGKHQADKTAVLLAAERRLGQVVKVDDDNQADALWLLAMALHHYGRPLCDVPVAQATALDSVQWPPFTLDSRR